MGDQYIRSVALGTTTAAADALRATTAAAVALKATTAAAAVALRTTTAAAVALKTTTAADALMTTIMTSVVLLVRRSIYFRTCRSVLVLLDCGGAGDPGRDQGDMAT